jgi:threonylcarbamoyladenosine tRNA methylthiotransferase MtaB
MKYAVVTFGCRVNQADSLEIEGELRARGATGAAPAEADLVIVNTCSVTAAADQGARQTIRRVARDNPAARIVVTGCYATRAPGDLVSLPQVMRVVPNTRKDDLVRDLALACEPTTAERFAGADGPCGSALEPGVAGRTALTLRVQTGCDERCSYCIIPSTRGAGRSRPLAAVREAVARAAAAGYREVAITGVHLGSYGRDLGDGTSLLSLARALAEWPGDLLFRLSSLEPMDCSRELVDLVAASPRLAPHFHLPLQHAADEMLAAMRRPYTRRFFGALVDRIRERMPHASIGSDVIVGFPGETGEHAAALVDYLETSPLTHVHVFPYSHRPGTEASRFGGVPPSDVVRARGAAVRAVGERLSRAFRAAQVGSIRRALVVDDGTAAVTDNYLKLRLDRPQVRNEWLEVVVTSETSARAVAAHATAPAPGWGLIANDAGGAPESGPARAG